MRISSTARTTRLPQVAGYFYPDEPDLCAAQVRRFLDAAPEYPEFEPKMIIAPHAGHVYSGPIAATGYKTLAARKSPIRRVVLLGPAHRVPFRGLVTTTADLWRSPCGDVTIDGAGRDLLIARRLVRPFEEGFSGEHSLEVHLPFLQAVLDDFSLVPILVGEASFAEVATCMDALWQDEGTVFVISSDLSHFHDYDTARRLDENTRVAIENLHEERLDGEAACGYRIIGGALLQARKHDLRATCVDLRNSGDTAGDRSRVVGYGAFVFEDAETARLARSDRERLIETASTALARRIDEGRGAAAQTRGTGRESPALRAWRATFVTLKKEKGLRGCIGTIAPQQALLDDVAANAVRAGFGDPRFPPLTRRELANLDVEISILSTPRPMTLADRADLLGQLRPFRDGLILEDGGRRGLFLPAVWESLPMAEDFLDHLFLKAGLAPDHWSRSLRFLRFTAEKFGGRLCMPAATGIRGEPIHNG